MDINVKVTVDLGDKTLALVNGAFAANAAVEQASNAVTSVLEKCAEAPAVSVKEEDLDTAKAEKPTRTRRTKEQIAADEGKAEKKADAPEGTPSFEKLDGDAKLEKIKSTVTKYTKEGKSADIKFMLAQFEAGRASELAIADYDAFFAALERYGAGESLDEIFSLA